MAGRAIRSKDLGTASEVIRRSGQGDAAEQQAGDCKAK
jgi:hypothetical protein